MQKTQKVWVCGSFGVQGGGQKNEIPLRLTNTQSVKIKLCLSQLVILGAGGTCIPVPTGLRVSASRGRAYPLHPTLRWLSKA